VLVWLRNAYATGNRYMIENFRDHAANERTYLAWIRTAIALIGFGFVIEKFNLFLRYLGRAVPEAAVPHDTHFAEGAGLAMLAIGLAIVAFATWGYARNVRLIDAPESKTYQAKLPNLLLGGVVAALGVALILYVAFTLSAGRS
jgi:putative membrane protein